MTFVVTANCSGCRFTDCVDVCPADCFHGDAQMLYINPRTCICCGACVLQCPVEAIYPEGTLPEEQRDWLGINAERSAHLPVILSRRDELAGAREKARKLGFRLE